MPVDGAALLCLADSGGTISGLQGALLGVAGILGGFLVTWGAIQTQVRRLLKDVEELKTSLAQFHADVGQLGALRARQDSIADDVRGLTREHNRLEQLVHSMDREASRTGAMVEHLMRETSGVQYVPPIVAEPRRPRQEPPSTTPPRPFKKGG